MIEDAQELEGSLLRARRTNAGWIMMGIPTEGNASPERASQLVQELEERNITGVISFHPPDSDIVAALELSEIELLHEIHDNRYQTYWNFHWWLGYDENWTLYIQDFVTRHGPSRIAIHCAHGVDRTGNSTAFLLATLFDVPIADAWYAVVARRSSDVNGLISVLEEFGIDDVRSLDDPSVGLYTYNGRGMGGRSDGYRNYIRHTISAAIDQGAQW